MEQTQPRLAGTPGATLPAGVSMRPAGAGDEEPLARLLTSLSPAAAFYRFLQGLGQPKPWLLRALLRREPARGCWLAFAGDQPVGHASWVVGPDGAVDLGLVVTDAWQRRGIGRALLAASVTEAVTAGATRLRLDVHPDNRPVVGALRRRFPGSLSLVDGLVVADVPFDAVLAVPFAPPVSVAPPVSAAPAAAGAPVPAGAPLAG